MLRNSAEALSQLTSMRNGNPPTVCEAAIIDSPRLGLSRPPALDRLLGLARRKFPKASPSGNQRKHDKKQNRVATSGSAARLQARWITHHLISKTCRMRRFCADGPGCAESAVLLRERKPPFNAVVHSPATMNARSDQSNEDFWVFGYGSLMWRPGFDFLERR